MVEILRYLPNTPIEITTIIGIWIAFAVLVVIYKTAPEDIRGLVLLPLSFLSIYGSLITLMLLFRLVGKLVKD